ncbi:putative ribonuclease H-like domain-containing protein [Tanacetum coccineum]
MVAQGYKQEEGNCYDEVFAPVARVEAIRGDNGFHRGQIDKTLFIKRPKGDILLVQVYVDDIIFSSTKKSLCDEFEQIMHNRFQMSSMGELTFFLGLQVKQKEDGIFISQDKYVGEILKKFGFSSIRTASTPMETNKDLTKDEDGEDVDVYLYRSMIGSLMYLTSSRPDIMFLVCACSRFQVQLKVSHLNAVKRIFRYLKGQPKLGLWYPKDSPLILEAFSDSTFCKKQTVVANSTTEAEYIVASHCCGQVLWIQNQMLDYGFNFMQTKIHVDNESVICVIKNPVYHSKTKHIEIRHHFIRDSYKKRLIEMVKIHTDHNVASYLTKGLLCKRGRGTLRLPQSGGPLIKVGDEAARKELGHRMERAATTASSLEVEQDSATARTSANGEVELTATIDGQVKTITEASLRRHLKRSLVTMPHESPLHSVHSLGRDEGSLSLSELTKVKKLEQTVKSTQARRRFRIVVSDDEEGLEDPSKQGRKITEIDQDPSISLVQDEGTSWIQEDIEIQEKISDDTEVVLEEEEPTELVEDQGSGEKGEKEVSTVGAEHSTVIPEPEPEKKTKKQLEQERLGHEEAVRLQEQLNEEERQRIARDAEIAKQLQEEINKATQEQEKQEVVTEADPTHVIDWSDPAVLRYHAQLNRPYSVAEVRKNMVMYLKNQGGYKMNYFKGMKYEDIRPIFEKVWDQIQSFAPMDSEKEKGSEKKGSRKKSPARKRAREEFAMKIESLGTKYPIVDWKTHVLTENFMYYQIIRAYRGSKNYKIFSEMLDDFDRHDVMDLHRLVEKAKKIYSLGLTRRMASSITRFDIEKFDGKNEFGLWQIKMCALMVQQGCDVALKTLPVDMEASEKAALMKKAYNIVVWEESLTMEDVLATLNSRELKKRTEGTKEETGDGLYVRGRSDHSEGYLKRDCPMKKSSGFVKKGKRNQDSDSSDDEGNTYFREAPVVVDCGLVQLGDNRTCTIKGTGKVKIQLHDGSSFILKDVRYVPGLRRSLISLGTLEKEGVKMQMGRIKVIKGCQVMMTRIRKKNCVYTLEAKVMTFGVQKHGGSKQVGFKQLGHKQVGFKQLGHKQVGFKQLGPGVETGVHGVQDEKRVWFEVELQGAQGDREAEVFQVSNDDAAVAQRRLEDKQPEEKTNTDCLVKEQEKVHLGIKVGANITVTGVPGQEGAEGNVAEKKKVKKSMKANLGKLLKYKAWLTRRSPVRGSSIG